MTRGNQTKVYKNDRQISHCCSQQFKSEKSETLSAKCVFNWEAGQVEYGKADERTGGGGGGGASKGILLHC